MDDDPVTPAVTLVSHADWTLDEHSTTTLQLDLDSTETTAGDSFTMGIFLSSVTHANTDGAYGSSTLTVSAAGVRDLSQESYLQTVSEQGDSFELHLDGTFSDSEATGTFGMAMVSSHETLATETTTVTNDDKLHTRDEESTSGSATLFTMGFDGDDFHFSLTANSTDSSNGERHLSETFLDGTLDHSTDQKITSGTGSSSNTYSFAFDLGDNNWYTFTGITAKARPRPPAWPSRP